MEADPDHDRVGPDPDALIPAGRLERRNRGKKGARKPRRQRGAGSSDRELILLIMALALVVFALGGVVLFLKLRPPPQADTMAGSFLQSAQEAVKANPDNPLAHVGLGAAYLRGNQISDAKAEFEKALELDPKNWQASLQLGTLLEESDPQRALTLLYVAAKGSPYKETPYFEIGNVQYQQGDYRAAKAAYIQSIAVEPAVYDSRMGLGKTYEALHQPDLALQQYEQALRLIPTDQAAKEAVARLTQEQAKA